MYSKIFLEGKLCNYPQPSNAYREVACDNVHMKHIGEMLREIEGTIILHAADPITQHGFTQVPNVILKNIKLSSGAKVTYAMFLSYAWQKDSAFPGQKRVAEDLGMSERHIRRFIGELKVHGLLSVERRGLGKTNVYHLYVAVNKLSKQKQQVPSR
jgi:hypothetical protein